MRIATALVSIGLLLGAATAWGADGSAIYAAQCAKCHGADGKGDTPVGRAMKAPSLVDSKHDAASVASTVRENPKHKSVAGNLSPEDLDAVARAVEAMSGAAQD